ncbi:MAG: hypothetical protein PF588_00485 [Candidatus Kapabacteria bacterium]|jgi:hypothetical protein|nr:hypothetical protein [Candidatus Kapabacteria bacterium]
MKNILSVNFAVKRTYISVLQPSPKGLILKYINSTNQPVSLLGSDPITEQPGAVELRNMLSKIEYEIGRVSVSLDSELVFFTQIPGKEEMNISDLKQLVQLEIRTAIPESGPDDFVSALIPMKSAKNTLQSMTALIFSCELLQSCKELFAVLNKPIQFTEAAHFAAHNAFLYNYPDQSGKTVALINIQEHIIELSAIHKGQPAYYNQLAYDDKAKITDLCISEFKKIQNEYADKIDSAYFFGGELNIDILANVQSVAEDTGLQIHVGRLNAFRMIRGIEDQRIKEYCIRTAHLYPACIGGNIPSYHKIIELS